MEQCIEEIVKRARPKVTAILRSRLYYSVEDLIGQFKGHIWGLIEYYTPCIYHAGISLLAKVDRLQERFLKELDLEEKDAFLPFNMAPLCTRRDIAILGLLHKCNLGLAHPGLQALFYRDPNPRQRDNRIFPPLHDRRLWDEHCFTRMPSLYHKSIFAQIRVYNLLSQVVVSHDNVKDFQSALTSIVRRKCSEG